MVQNNLPGEQTMQWEKKNKEVYIIQSAKIGTVCVCFTIVVENASFRAALETREGIMAHKLWLKR